jgi:hypothetical protein
VSYDSEVTADAPVGWWKLDETSGTTATNSGSVGAAINGTYTGTYTRGAASLLPAKPTGKSLQLTGAGYVAIPYNAGINLNGAAYSTESWFRFSVMTQMAVFSRENNFRQYVTSGKAGTVHWGTGAVTAVNFSNDDIDDDAGHHIVAVYSNPDYRLYVDGLLQSQVWDNLTTVNNDTSTAMRIGQSSSGGLQFAGYIDEVALYNTALSAARVAAHYTAGAAKVTFLNQQWQLLAADSMVLTTSASALDALVQSVTFQILHADGAVFTADLLPVLRIAVGLATSATITPTLTPQQYLGVAFLDSASIAQQLTASKFGQIVLSESAAVLGVLTAGQKVSISLADIITAAVIIKAGDEEMVGWIVNPNLAASTALDNYDFTGFGQHDGKHYGIRPDGLYVLEGDDDDGTQIDSFISLGNRNFNTAKQKRVPHAYIGASTDGRMVLKVIVNGQEYLYAVKNPSTDMAEQRVDIGRGLRSNYWNFELMNREGADFEIDTIKFMPIVLERRI